MSRTSPRRAGTCTWRVAISGVARAATACIRCGVGTSSDCGWLRNSGTRSCACRSLGCSVRTGCGRRVATSSTCSRGWTSRNCTSGTCTLRSRTGGNWKAVGSGGLGDSLTCKGCAASAGSGGTTARTCVGVSASTGIGGCAGIGTCAIAASGRPLAGDGVAARCAGAAAVGAESAPAFASAPPPSATLPRPMNSTCTASSSSSSLCASAR